MSVEVPHGEGRCCGELEARRRRNNKWEGYVRCTDEHLSVSEACSGWFDWGDVQDLVVEDVSAEHGERPTDAP